MVWIAVVDPLPLFEAGMAAALGAEGHHVEVPSDLVGWVREHDGCVVVITLAAEPAWMLLTAVAAITGDVFIVALLPVQDGTTGLQAIRAGAHSVLGRDTSPSRLQRTVEAAIGGLAQLPVDVVRALHETAAQHPVHGATAVARLLVRVAARLPIDVDLRYRRGNGDPAVVLLVAGSPVAVLVLDLDDDDAHRVRGIYSITNPDKLSRAR